MSGFTNIFLSQGSQLSFTTEEDDPDFEETFMLLHAEFNQLYEVTNFPNISIVGDGSISTAQAKFGTQSFYNPGTAISVGGLDYISVIGSEGDFVFPTDFTWEGWFFMNAQQDQFMNIFTNNITFPSAGFIQLARRNTGNIFFNAQGVGSLEGGPIPLQQWVHLAAVRTGSTLTLYVNGVGTSTTVQAGAAGGNNDGVSTFDIGRAIANDNGDLDAYFEEIRVSKVARYTSNFIPPTAPFPPYPGL